VSKLADAQVLYTKNQGLWKITDFGLTSEGTSKALQNTTSARGTGGYRAPEMIREGKKGYNNKIDVWAVGCIFYEMIVGERPFADDWAVHQYSES
jgi:serine/threonine protein kinase